MAISLYPTVTVNCSAGSPHKLDAAGGFDVDIRKNIREPLERKPLIG